MAKRTICFTGHRPHKLYGYGCSAWSSNQRLLLRIADEMEALIAADGGSFQGYDFISGGAQGADQLCFWAVQELKERLARTRPDITVRNIVYIPFKGQELLWPANGNFGQREYHAMLDRADVVVDVSGGKRPTTSSTRLMFARSHAMVDSSDLLVCIWNEPFIPGASGNRGGTNECVRYALSHDRRVLVVDLNRHDVYDLDHTVLLGEEGCAEPAHRRAAPPTPPSMLPTRR